MKTYSPILIVAGEPNSIFFEIFFKAQKIKKFKSPIILIGSLNLLKLQMKKLNVRRKINSLNPRNFNEKKLNNKTINIIDVNYNTSVAFEKISKKSNQYIENSFEMATKIMKEKFIYKFINGPISKKYFLKKKYLGVTEYLTNKFSSKKSAMLIFNQKLSVCPVTTHLPLKYVAKRINPKIIMEKINLIDNFYLKIFKKKPKIALLGLNPHCETIDNFDEDKKVIKPTIKKAQKRKFKISGPYSADTIFIKENRKKFDVIIGIYHDQVLTPMKTLFEYDAINITLGLPFIRVSPDHGPNEKMLGKNMSNPLSLIKAIEFLDKN